jgi:hypothetical protein
VTQIARKFSDWYNSLPDGEPSFQMTFEAGYQAALHSHPEHVWMPITPELLSAIENGEYGGTSFWLACKGLSSPVSGEYEWQQGRSPHGFNDARGCRLGSDEVTHLMPYSQPSLPSV